MYVVTYWNTSILHKLCYILENIYQSKTTLESFVCYQHAQHDQTLYQIKQCLIVFCMLKANAGLLRLFAIVDIKIMLIYSTIQYMYKCHHHPTYTNVYIDIRSTLLYKGHFKNSFHQARLAHSVEPLVTNLKVVGSSPL